MEKDFLMPKAMSAIHTTSTYIRIPARLHPTSLRIQAKFCQQAPHAVYPSYSDFRRMIDT
jgi:hypothetical protein